MTAMGAGATSTRVRQAFTLLLEFLWQVLWGRRFRLPCPFPAASR